MGGPAWAKAGPPGCPTKQGYENLTILDQWRTQRKSGPALR
jgi:hypothetical protein